MAPNFNRVGEGGSGTPDTKNLENKGEKRAGSFPPASANPTASAKPSQTEPNRVTASQIETTHQTSQRQVATCRTLYNEERDGPELPRQGPTPRTTSLAPPTAALAASTRPLRLQAAPSVRIFSIKSYSTGSWSITTSSAESRCETFVAARARARVPTFVGVTSDSAVDSLAGRPTCRSIRSFDFRNSKLLACARSIRRSGNCS